MVGALEYLGVPLLLTAYWAFGTYVGDLATPWTIGWIILWLIFSPAATWTGVLVMGAAPRLSTASVLALMAAAPFSSDALTIVTTLFVAALLGTNLWLWVPIAAFVAVVTAIYAFHTGGFW